MSKIPLLGQPKDKSYNQGPLLRLLHCMVCSSLEELPPFEGLPEHDHLLAIACERHRFPSGEEHKGLLFIVPVMAWANKEAREDIIRQIKGGGLKGLAEIDDKYYESKSTFSADAMTCWKKHNSPQDSCGDYEDSSKRLLPDTGKERKELGLASLKDAPGPKNYLCHFCPIHSKVVTRKRQLLGMYDGK
jgi:hypothetical protein